MKTTSRLVALALALLSCYAHAQTTPKGPTMGWSSWNTYYCNISDSIIRSQADAMVNQGLYKHGYKYVNIDDGFFGGRNMETGELIIHPQRFPNGLKPVADYIHGLGLKAGIYSDAGANTCGNRYNGDTLSVNVGLYRFDQHDADLYFNTYGFDFIKVDFCGGDAPQNFQHLALDPQQRYTAIHQAIENTGRKDVRFNVCRWNYPGTWVHDVSTSWRMSQDIYCGWKSVKDIIHQNLYLSAYCYDGCFNDMDMLETGRTMSQTEDETHFAMWCMMSSPLLIGCDMNKLRPETHALLTNDELIAVNQDTLYEQAYVVAHEGDTYVLTKDLVQRLGNMRAVALYNPTDEAREISISASALDCRSILSARDLLLRTDAPEALSADGKTLKVLVPAHGIKAYRIVASKRTERTLYEAETAYLSSYQELSNNQALGTANYTERNGLSGGAKVDWLGHRPENDIQWRHVVSKKAGKRKLTFRVISGEPRTFTVDVNGQEVGTFTANSCDWEHSVDISLKACLRKGNNVIRLHNDRDWMPDVDCMLIK